MLGHWVRETTTSTSNGDLALTSVSGYPTFNAVFGTSAYFLYAILDDSDGTPIEIGVGHLSASTTLVRDLPIATYSSGTYDDTAPAAVSLAAGTKRVICTASAESMCPATPALASAVGGTNFLRSLLPEVMSGSVSLTVTKDRLYYSPIEVAMWARVSHISAMNGNTAGTSGTRGFRVGLYDTLPNGSPGNKIAESGDIASSINAELVYTLGTPLRLKPGRYWTAVCEDYSGTSPNLYASASTSTAGAAVMGINKAGGFGARNVGLYEALSAGWASLPSSAASSLTSLTQAPYVALRLE